MDLQIKMKRLILIYLIFHHDVYTTKTTTVRRKIGQSYKLTCGKTEHKNVRGCYLQAPKGVIYVLWSGARWEKGRIVPDINHPCSTTKVQTARRDDEGFWECHQFIQSIHGTVTSVNKIEVIIDPTFVVNQHNSTLFTNHDTLSPQEMVSNSTNKKRKEPLSEENEFHTLKIAISCAIASICAILIMVFLSIAVIRRTNCKKNGLAELNESRLTIKG